MRYRMQQHNNKSAHESIELNLAKSFVAWPLFFGVFCAGIENEAKRSSNFVVVGEIISAELLV